MASASIISLFSAIISIIGIIIVFFILSKVYQENYKKPWIFIGLSAIFLAISQLINFFAGSFNFYIYNSRSTEFLTLILEFISMTLLTYGLFLEGMILKFYKGKFVKFKLVPVQESNLGGNLDIDVVNGNTYLTLKKENSFLIEQLTQATRKGYEGFLITSETPKVIRTKYRLDKSPIAWITNLNPNITGNYVRESLDENSELVDPIRLNDLISFTDNFLDAAENPFILFELDLLLTKNSYSIILEFIRYTSSRVKSRNGIAIYSIKNNEILSQSQIIELKNLLQLIE